MAAFCHPHPGGGRFDGADRGAWYAALDLDTAHAEVIFCRSRELAEVGVTEAKVEMRQYLAEFAAAFHDLRGDEPGFAPLHDPHRYDAAQRLTRDLVAAGPNGVLCRSVRRPGGECIECFRPRLVLRVRQAAHLEYRWAGGRLPSGASRALRPTGRRPNPAAAYAADSIRWASAADRNSSMSPSSTAWVAEVSTPVRRSLTIW
jgi:hypothetical protein